MKRIQALLCFLVLSSCAEKFKQIDVEKFNTEISQNTSIKSAEELITLYYNWPISEGKPNLEISKLKFENNLFEITMIHDHLEDDSQKAEKIVMVARKLGNKWKVEEIKRNWKCYDDRGETDWGISSCN